MSEMVETRLKKVIKENYKASDIADNIRVDETLAAFGLNSVEFVKLVVMLENEFGFEFDNEHLDFAKFSTIRDIVDYVESKI